MSTTDAERPLDALGIAGAVFCCALWGGNAVAVKFSVPDLPPFGCASFRFALGLPLIAIGCRMSGQPLWPKRDAWLLLLLNAAVTVIQIGSFNWGTEHSQAGRSSIFINVHPLIVAPLAWAFLREPMGWRGGLGLLSAAGGVVVLLSEKAAGSGPHLIGDLVVLASGLIFGAQTILQKKTFPVIPPATLLFSQSVLAIPIFLAVSGLGEGFSTYRFTTDAMLGVLYQGLAVSGICFTVWMLLLKRYPAGKLATLAFLTPFFGVGLGNLMRGERLTLALIGGGVLVAIGIYLVASDRTVRHVPADILLPGEDAL
jgi:drug/metabolite transporter (DMT)-like permease